MKFIYLSFILSAQCLMAADWYVANTGAAGAPGTFTQPVATVAEAIGRSGGADIIHLQRGETFREGPLSPGGRTLRAYGNAAFPLPILAGSSPVSGWTTWSGNSQVLTAPFTLGAVHSLFLNGSRVTLARTPNTGFLRVDNESSDNVIVDAALSSLPGAASGRWVGAQVRWRKWTWIYETRPITADNGTNTLTLGGSTSLAGLTGIDSGYFIDNTLAALDAPGEWYYNDVAKRIYLYPPAGTNTETMVVEAGWRTEALSLSGSTIEDIAIQHYNVGVSVNAASTLRRVLIQHIATNGISGTWNAGGTLITGCTLRDILDNGINWVENPGGAGGTVFERNTLLRIGAVQGLGGSGSWRSTGIALFVGPPITVRLNRITEAGYAGILPGVAGCIIQRNVLTRCMATLNDGGAIYTNTNKTLMRENIILDTIGNVDSSHPWTPLGHGIWPEFLGKFRDTEITNNTIYGSGGHGIWLPNNYNCNVSNNICLSNRLAAFSLGGVENDYATPADFQQNHTMQNNILGIGARPWAPYPGQPQNLATWAAKNDYLLDFKVYTDRDLDYGTTSGTHFLTCDGTDLIRNSSNVPKTIAQWQSEEFAWADPAPVATVAQGFLFINDSESSVNFTLPPGVTWQTLAGATAGATVPLAPFRSVVLLATSGSTTALSSYYLQSNVTSTGFESFRTTHSLAANGSQDLLMPADDGVQNILKYAFNMIGTGIGQVTALNIPNSATITASSTAGKPLAVRNGAGRLTITYIRRKSSSNPGVTYNAEFSSNCTTWAVNDSATVEVTDINANFERVFVTDTSSALIRFVRMKVSSP